MLPLGKVCYNSLCLKEKYYLIKFSVSFITILHPKPFNIFSRYKSTIEKLKQLNVKRQQWCGRVDSSWAKAAIKRPEKMEKHQEFLKQQQICILKEQEALHETKTNNWVSSEALISVELEVDDALYLEHSNDNKYMHDKTNDRKSKTVHRRNSMDETQSEWQFPGQPQNYQK